MNLADCVKRADGASFTFFYSQIPRLLHPDGPVEFAACMSLRDYLYLTHRRLDDDIDDGVKRAIVAASEYLQCAPDDQSHTVHFNGAHMKEYADKCADGGIPAMEYVTQRVTNALSDLPLRVTVIQKMYNTHVKYSIIMQRKTPANVFGSNDVAPAEFIRSTTADSVCSAAKCAREFVNSTAYDSLSGGAYADVGDLSSTRAEVRNLDSRGGAKNVLRSVIARDAGDAIVAKTPKCTSRCVTITKKHSCGTP